ncbi:glycoside hydrolase superfamily [Infundibulicybe gibba]|nr:glycoside hydrolase superfamily [Infundibulicybe gibba]
MRAEVALGALLYTLGLVQGSYKPSPSVLISRNTTLPLNALDASYTENSTECTVVPYLSPPVYVPAFPSFDPAAAQVYRYRRQQSVNLGSWFVHEQWMTPSLFTCASGSHVSELDIASGWGDPASARALLERHWDTFITPDDFNYLASIGINTVRLPIGYWSLGPDWCAGTPFEGVGSVYAGSWPRVMRAINMAAGAGIGVLVDMHGAIGSQNGQPHSGVSDGVAGLWGDEGNAQKTIDALVFIAREVMGISNVIGLQVLNEPNNVARLPDFYGRAITAIRAVTLDLPLYVHDGFDIDRFSAFVGDRTDFIVEDHHSYFVFTPSDSAEPAAQHTADMRNTVADELSGAATRARGNLVVDEWSCALTPQSMESAGPNGSEARRNFCTAQVEVYTNTTAGWSFWSYTKEGCDTDPGWCFKSAVGTALPSTFFSYPETTKWTDPGRIAGLIAGLGPTMPPSSWGSKRSGSGRRHRFEAIKKRGDARERGYDTGYTVAKAFAASTAGMSKLGFREQYVADEMVREHVANEDGEAFREGFLRGLGDGERDVANAVIM